MTYSGNVRFSDATNIPEMLDSYTFAQYFNRAARQIVNGGTVFSKEQTGRIKAYRWYLKTSATFNDNHADGTTIRDRMQIPTGLRKCMKIGFLPWITILASVVAQIKLNILSVEAFSIRKV